MNIFKRITSKFKKHDNELFGPSSNVNIDYKMSPYEYLLRFVANKPEDNVKVSDSKNKYTVYKNHSSTVIIERKSGKFEVRFINPKLLSSSEKYVVNLLVNIINTKIELKTYNYKNPFIKGKTINQFDLSLLNLGFKRVMRNATSAGVKTSDLFKGVNNSEDV